MRLLLTVPLPPFSPGQPANAHALLMQTQVVFPGKLIVPGKGYLIESLACSQAVRRTFKATKEKTSLTVYAKMVSAKRREAVVMDFGNGR